MKYQELKQAYYGIYDLKMSQLKNQNLFWVLPLPFLRLPKLSAKKAKTIKIIMLNSNYKWYYSPLFR